MEARYFAGQFEFGSFNKMNKPTLFKLAAAAITAAAISSPAKATVFTYDFTLAGNAASTNILHAGTVSSTTNYTLNVGGVTCVQNVSTPTYCTNAAGVVITPGINPGQNTGTVQGNPPAAALIFTFNALASAPAFIASASNGLGQTDPSLIPTTLARTGTLSDYNFGATPVAGFSLLITNRDSFKTDNTGSYSGRLTIDDGITVAAVSEPAMGLAVFGLGAAGAFAARRRRQVTPKLAA